MVEKRDKKAESEWKKKNSTTDSSKPSSKPISEKMKGKQSIELVIVEKDKDEYQEEEEEDEDSGSKSKMADEAYRKKVLQTETQKLGSQLQTNLATVTRKVDHNFLTLRFRISRTPLLML